MLKQFIQRFLDSCTHRRMRMYEILTLALSFLVFFQTEKIVSSLFKFSKLLSDQFFNHLGMILQLPLKLSFHLVKRSFLVVKGFAKYVSKRSTSSKVKTDRYSVEPILKVTPLSVQQLKQNRFGNNKREPVTIEYIED